MQVANAPLKWLIPWAQQNTSIIELPETTSDPNRASQRLGFPANTMLPPESGGVPPQGIDFNAGLYQVARITWWLMYGAPFAYDATFATNSAISGYAQGAQIASSDYLGAWLNTTDNNQINPDTVGTGWVPGYVYGHTTTALTNANVTLTPLQAAKRTLVFTGVMTANVTVTLPAWIYDWTIVNGCTGGFTLTVIAAGGGGLVAGNGPTQVHGDGVNIVLSAPPNIVANGTPTYATVALMNADLSPRNATIVTVTADPTTSNNSYWQKVGASGTGSWVQCGDRLTQALGNGAGYQPAGTGAIATTFQAKGRQTMHLFDVLTPAQIADTQTGSPTLDLTSLITQAFANAAALGKKLIIAGVCGCSFNATTGIAVSVPSNTVAEWEPSALIKPLGPFNANFYSILDIRNASNVHLIRPNVDGNNAQNTATSGEFGVGVAIRTSSNVIIEDAVTTNTWGDGIYIGQVNSGDAVSDVHIIRHRATSVRRNGVSLITGTNIQFDDCEWSSITATAPGAGIDIEPNDNTAVLRNIVVNRCRSSNNTIGFSVALHALPGATAQYVDIRFINCSDNNCSNGRSFSPLNPGTNTVIGEVSFTDHVSIASGLAALVAIEYAAAGPLVKDVRPVIIDPNASAGSSQTYNVAIAWYRDSGSANTYPIGNLMVLEPSIICVTTTLPRLFCFRDITNSADTFVTNMHFRDPMQLKGITGNGFLGWFAALGTISDKYNVWGFQIAGSSTLNVNTYATQLLPSVSSTQTLPNVPAGSPDIPFVQTAGVTSTIATASGGNFMGQSSGTNLVCTGVNSAGCTIALRPLGGNVWMQVNKAGIGWSF